MTSSTFWAPYNVLIADSDWGIFPCYEWKRDPMSELGKKTDENIMSQNLVEKERQ